MKKLMWLLFLVLSVSVLGCSRRDSENVDSLDKNKNIEKVGIELEMLDKSNNANRANANSELSLKADKNIISVSSEVNDSTQSNYVYSYGKDLGYKLFRKQFPVFNDDAVYYHKYKGTYSEFEDDFIKYLCSTYYEIKIDSSDHNDMSFIGTQTIPIENRNKLVYEFKFKLDEDIGLYQCLYYRLINREDIFDEVDYISPVAVELLEMEKDDNRFHLIPIFEEYMNKTSSKNKDEPIEVLNYIKGNFTNSEYDEYIVFFKQGASYDDYGDEVEDDHIKYTECMVVSEGVIIQSYSIYGLYGDIGVDEYYNDTLGAHFSQGYVGDYNKNGINELLINCYIKNSRADTTHMVEFHKDHFETFVFLANSFSRNCLTYDFGKGVFLYEYSVSRHISAGYGWTQEFAWSEKERCYIVLYKIREDIKLD